MKRILVVDESPAVRETLALILGREFEVVQRQDPTEKGLSLYAENVDLLILGFPSGQGESPLTLSKIASQVPWPVLCLLDSRPPAGSVGEQGRVDWLAKPFNPYELKEKVTGLLASAGTDQESSKATPGLKGRFDRYLSFPYLPKPVSDLAKKYAVFPVPILMMGEEGCGQENIARAIHALSPQAGPWIPIYLPEMGEGFNLGKPALSAGMKTVEGGSATLFLAGLEGLGFSGQASLLRFLQQEEDSGRELWILSTSTVDLLEKVYQREFLEPLYYRLATLTLRIPPLRDRVADLPALAGSIAKECARRLNLGSISFSPDALGRLGHYLWFGNIKELETVLTRTLVVHRKGLVEASDLVWDMGGERGTGPSDVKGDASRQRDEFLGPGQSNGHFLDIRILISELAHELKNPMVTIKTFAQLLGERFDDSTFRSQFQERVGSDIDRMDGILEALVDFCRFSQPNPQEGSLWGQLQRVFEELVPECVERDTSIRWGERGEEIKVFVDPQQFRYTLINILRMVLSQVKAKCDIKIDIGQDGKVSISYDREGSGTSPLSTYLDPASRSPEDEALPLRVLLAKNLLERAGGALEISRRDDSHVQIRIVVPALHH